MKLRPGQRITGVYMGMVFSGKVRSVRLVDNYGRAADIGEATIDVDFPETLGDRELLFPVTTPTFELADSRFESMKERS